MRALTRSSGTVLALILALVVSAAAAEREAPSGAFPVLPAAAPVSAQAPRLPDALPGAPISPSITVAPAVPAVPALPPSSAAAAQGPTAAAGVPRAQAQAPRAHAAAEPPAPQSGVAGLPAAIPGSASAEGSRASAGQSGGAETAAQIIEQLAPENASRLSDEQASDLAGKLIDPRGGSESGEGVDASGGAQPQGLRLAPWQKHSVGGSSWLVPETEISAKKAAEPKPTRAERRHYSRLWNENLYFYIVTNIRNKWAPYYGYWKKIKASGTPPPVSQPRKFFAHMRVFGQTGEFYIPGFTPLEDPLVVKEAMETFDRFFDAPYIGKRERDAFEGFVLRASVYNKERRAASKFRATVRDNLLKASTMPPEKIAPFFDGLPTVEKTAEFQSAEADAILEKFKAMVLEEVAKEPKDAKDRVTGVILIGSFALGAATPKSDFDVEPLTADGGSGRVREFAARVTKRWEEMGRQSINPVSFHYFGYLESRWEIRAIHHEPYLIFSPDPSLVEKLSMRPGEPPSHVPSRKLTAWGQFLRWAQYAAVTLTSYTVRPQKL